MAARSSSPAPLAFRRKSQIPDGPLPSHNDIFFPKVYEEAWGESENGTTSRTDLDRARIFLIRMAMLNRDNSIMHELTAVVKNQQVRSIPALASAIQMRIFRDRHGSFTPTPLMQCVRFILLKARVNEVMPTQQNREVMDFFFDPTLERNLNPLPSGETVTYQYPSGRLKVAICGGGPTALASAISLAEKGAGKVEVHMYERRWVEKRGPDGRTYMDYPPTARRRDQVVTLQDSVTSLLSPASYQALFAGRPERVWPGSANIQIRKVEDRFLKRVQQPDFQGLVYLHAKGLSKENFADEIGDFHVLLGADGAASWVRKSYFHGYENERGKSYALGLAFDRPAGLPWSQPLNVFLTLGQTRYLLNASDYDGRGYLNMQLTEDEWDKMRAIDGQYVHFGRPGCLRKPDGSVPDGFKETQVFAPSDDRESPLWIAILDGLKLFGFKEEEVINVVRIPIVVQAVKEGVQLLPPGDSPHLKRPHALVAVAGDAAMTVHFWPGRGLNSGIKSGLALGDELVHALNNGKFIGINLGAMKEYNDFILKLQNREHDKRSIPILNQSGSPETLGWLLEKASTVPDNVAIDWLIGAMVQIADRLEGRPDWAFPPTINVEPQLRIVLRQLDSMTLKEMAVSFPWPTREMAGAEVLPARSMKPEEKQKWLQGLWGMLKDDKKKARPVSRGPVDPNIKPASNSRFEAPRSKSPLPRPTSPAPGFIAPATANSGLKRTNATQSVRHIKQLSVPGTDDDARNGRRLIVPDVNGARSRSPSPGEMTLGRMLTVHKKPPTNVLTMHYRWPFSACKKPRSAEMEVIMMSNEAGATRA